MYKCTYMYIMYIYSYLYIHVLDSSIIPSVIFNPGRVSLLIVSECGLSIDSNVKRLMLKIVVSHSRILKTLGTEESLVSIPCFRRIVTLWLMTRDGELELTSNSTKWVSCTPRDNRVHTCCINPEILESIYCVYPEILEWITDYIH